MKIIHRKTINLFLSLMFLGGLSMLPLNDARATISTTTNKVIYNGAGTTSIFSFSFKIYRTSDLVVQTYTQSTGALLATLVLNTDYTVTINANGTGTVTLLGAQAPLPSGRQLLILRQLPLTQLISFSDNVATPAASYTEGYDRSTILSQQIQEQVTRSVLQNALNSTTLTLPAAVAGQCLGWAGDSTITNLTCSGSSGGGGGSAFNPPIADSQLQAITTASKVNGSALYSLASIGSGSGTIPAANLNLGTSASQIVQLTAAAKYPAVDGSLITNLAGSNFAGLASIPSGAGVIPIANIATGTPTGSKFVRDDGTLQVVTTSTGITFVSNTSVTAAANTTDIAITNTNFYKVHFIFYSVSADDTFLFRITNDTGANYNYMFDGRTTGGAITGGAAATTAINLGTAMKSGGGATNIITGEFLIYPINSTVVHVNGAVNYLNAAASLFTSVNVAGSHDGTATSFRILTSGGATFSGSVYVYKYSLS